MNKRIKNHIKTALVVFTAICFVPQSNALAYGDNVITNPFTTVRPAFDVNLDGEFDILDLVRLKNYSSGEKTTVDLSVFSYVDGADSEQAMLTVRNALLNK